jgi:hypothetical protein
MKKDSVFLSDLRLRIGAISVITVILLLFVLLMGEIFFRCRIMLLLPSKNNMGFMELHDRRGWTPSVELRATRHLRDASGQPYEAVISFDAKGFRAVPDAKQQGTSVLVLGDSFTQCLDVGDKETWYNRLAIKKGWNVRAFGCGGYGNLQEYLVLKEYLSEVKPEIVILQLSENDIINNSYDLERASTQNNNGLPRPYLTKERTVEIRLPKAFPTLRLWVIKNSRFLYWLMMLGDRIFSHFATSVEDSLMRNQFSDSRYKEALGATQYLLDSMASELPKDTMRIAFSVDTNPATTYMDEMASKAGWKTVDGLGSHIQKIEALGKCVRARDGSHWNPAGDEIAADYLSAQLDFYLGN